MRPLRRDSYAHFGDFKGGDGIKRWRHAIQELTGHTRALGSPVHGGDRSRNWRACREDYSGAGATSRSGFVFLLGLGDRSTLTGLSPTLPCGRIFCRQSVTRMLHPCWRTCVDRRARGCHRAVRYEVGSVPRHSDRDPGLAFAVRDPCMLVLDRSGSAVVRLSRAGWVASFVDGKRLGAHGGDRRPASIRLRLGRVQARRCARDIRRLSPRPGGASSAQWLVAMATRLRRLDWVAGTGGPSCH